MNRKDAKIIAETITNEQLQQMFDTAKEQITDWTVVSSVNKGMSKGVGWNILANGFDVKYHYHSLAKVNMIREFGDYLPDHIKPIKVKKKSLKAPIHQEPMFKTKSL